MSWKSPDIERPDTRRDDPRIGYLLSQTSLPPGEARVVIAGFPSDEGVRRNGGRTGASSAPDAIRQALYRLTPDPTRLKSWKALLNQTVDLGNLDLEDGALAKNQKEMGQLLSALVDQDVFLIILGGGHETAFAHFSAYARAERPIAIINIDAHLDVRPFIDGKPHSGSPFRQALEDPSSSCSAYMIIGALRHSVASAHAQYVAKHGGQIHWRDELNTDWIEQYLSTLSNETMVTFDMDALDQSLAPGVSAPAAGGLTQSEWLTAAFQCGKNHAVKSVDLSEVNPTVDESARTSALAGLTIWHLLDGLTHR